MYDWPLTGWPRGACLCTTKDIWMPVAASPSAAAESRAAAAEDAALWPLLNERPAVGAGAGATAAGARRPGWDGCGSAAAAVPAAPEPAPASVSASASSSASASRRGLPRAWAATRGRFGRLSRPCVAAPIAARAMRLPPLACAPAAAAGLEDAGAGEARVPVLAAAALDGPASSVSLEAAEVSCLLGGSVAASDTGARAFGAFLAGAGAALAGLAASAASELEVRRRLRPWAGARAFSAFTRARIQSYTDFACASSSMKLPIACWTISMSREFWSLTTRYSTSSSTASSSLTAFKCSMRSRLMLAASSAASADWRTSGMSA
mmetsp:Transcript_26498/g.99684  ORF Transcript_26498/g.99684 Transcript_26498/m.99684 type:complete len:322 (+) Transcript_26498:768-1733(+)